jgi:hypothetical protein
MKALYQTLTNCTAAANFPRSALANIPTFFITVVERI